jgi:hypothetical protein
MAIKVPGNMESLSLTVTLRDGTVIGPADTSNQPFGQSERVVVIWQGDTLVMYPMELVAKVEMHFAG